MATGENTPEYFLDTTTDVWFVHENNKLRMLTTDTSFPFKRTGLTAGQPDQQIIEDDRIVSYAPDTEVLVHHGAHWYEATIIRDSLTSKYVLVRLQMQNGDTADQFVLKRQRYFIEKGSERHAEFLVNSLLRG